MIKKYLITIFLSVVGLSAINAYAIDGTSTLESTVAESSVEINSPLPQEILESVVFSDLSCAGLENGKTISSSEQPIVCIAEATVNQTSTTTETIQFDTNSLLSLEIASTTVPNVPQLDSIESIFDIFSTSTTIASSTLNFDSFSTSTTTSQAIITFDASATSTQDSLSAIIIDATNSLEIASSTQSEQISIGSLGVGSTTQALIVLDTSVATTTEASSTSGVLSNTLEFLVNIPEAVLGDIFLEDLEWEKSYSTIGFDTQSGDLEPGDYALSEDGKKYYYREFKNNSSKSQFSVAIVSSAVIDITKYRRVNINGTAHYNEFRDKKGIIYREKTSKKEYDNLAKPKAKQPRKTTSSLRIKQAHAAIVFDAATTTRSTIVSSLTFAHTVSVSGTNRHLVVNVQATDGTFLRTVNSVTYAGVGLSSVTNTSFATYRLHLWHLVAPGTGTNNVVITLNGASDNLMGGAVSRTGVAQTSTLGRAVTATEETGNDTTPTINVPSAVNQVVHDGMLWDRSVGAATATVGSGQTQRQNATHSGDSPDYQGGAGSDEPGAGTVTMSWTLSAGRGWLIAGVSINPADGPDNSNMWWNFIKAPIKKVFAAENNKN